MLIEITDKRKNPQMMNLGNLRIILPTGLATQVNISPAIYKTLKNIYFLEVRIVGEEEKTARMEPVVEEPVVAETMVAETMVAETMVAETMVEEPVVEEAMVAETMVAETMVAETMVAETMIEEPTEENTAPDYSSHTIKALKKMLRDRGINYSDARVKADYLQLLV